MAYTIRGELFLGAGNTGLTLTMALKDDAGAPAAGLTSPSVLEVAASSGAYHYSATIPDNQPGYITFSSGATYKTHVTVNPEEVVNAYQRNLIADHVLCREWSSITLPEGTRTAWQALRFLRNAWEIVAAVISIKKEDGTTEAYSKAVLTDPAAVPVVGAGN